MEFEISKKRKKYLLWVQNWSLEAIICSSEKLINAVKFSIEWLQVFFDLRIYFQTYIKKIINL